MFCIRTLNLPRFTAKLSSNGVIAHPNSTPPAHLDKLREWLLSGTPDPAWDEAQYKRYTNLLRRRRPSDTKTATRMATVLTELLGGTNWRPAPSYSQATNQPFTGFPANAGFNDGLEPPKPWFIESYTLRNYNSLPLVDALPGAVICPEDPHSPTLPHIAGEWIGKQCSLSKAVLRSAYTGAALLYARHQALARMGKKEKGGAWSRVFTFVTDGRRIVFFAHHMVVVDDDDLGNKKGAGRQRRVEYHQYQIDSVNLTASLEEFRRGKQMLRRLREVAEACSFFLNVYVSNWLRQRERLVCTGSADGSTPE